MKENKVLKYIEKEEFNSNILKQYDKEGQKYFLGYLLRKGYNFNIKDGAIEFKDITSEDKIKEIIEKYNNESIIENLYLKKEVVKAISVIGINEYNKTLDRKIRTLRIKESKSKER